MNPNARTDTYLSVVELAELLKVPKSTVYGWNHDGTGPRLLRVGGLVRYRLSDVEAWIEKNTAASARP